MALSFEALRRVVRHLGQLALLRGELAAEELALARRQWLGWIVMAMAAAALLAVALAALGAWLTLLLWDRFGAATPLVLALLAGGGGGLLLRSLLRAAASAPPALARTRAALREDYEALADAVVPDRRHGEGH